MLERRVWLVFDVYYATFKHKLDKIHMRNFVTNAVK